MLKFMRNKLIDVRVHENDPGLFVVHGVLEDDIYGLELDLTIRRSDMRLIGVEGCWNHYTTPECPRALLFLKEAEGFLIEAEGFGPKVHKVVGRKGCRHFANLMLECCHSAREAALILGWEEAKKGGGELSLEEYLQGVVSAAPKPAPKAEAREEKPAIKESAPAPAPAEMAPPPDGCIIDLHVHTFPASPCSSANVDLLIEEARRIGLSGVCLTDHNYLWEQAALEDLRQRHGFLILGGNEITTDQGDMLVFGLDKNYKGIVKLDDLKKDVDQADAFMIVAHPFRGFLVFGASQVGLTPEKAMERALFKMVDAVEVLNGKVTADENAFARQVAEGLKLPMTGGSDAHEVEEVGQYATRFESKIHNEQDLIEALKARGYQPLAYRRERGL